MAEAYAPANLCPFILVAGLNYLTKWNSVSSCQTQTKGRRRLKVIRNSNFKSIRSAIETSLIIFDAEINNTVGGFAFNLLSG